jgi:hypothetical protein
MASSSVRSGPGRNDGVMESIRVPERLAVRLGDEATLGLLELLDHEQDRWSDQMLNVAAERFERRLTHEVSALRVDLSRELHEGMSGVRHEMATGRTDLFKWSFLFWVGQVVAMASLLAFMLRGRP